MDRKYLTVIGIALAAAILLGAAGIGYSSYMGNTYSEHNTMDVTENSVDIYKDGTPISTPMGMPSFVRNGSATISGYRVATTGPGTISLQCQMSNNASWALIESMTLTIDDANLPTPYAFGIIKDGMTVTTAVPTSSINMNAERTFTPDDRTLLYYDFTINITFADVDITEDPNWETLSEFEGTQFAFTFMPSAS